MQPRRPGPGLSKDALSASRQRVVRTAGEVAFLEPQVSEHPVSDGNVLRFTPVGRARERQLIVSPLELIETTGVEERHDLKELGARPPVGDERCLTRMGAQRTRGVDDRGVYAVHGLHTASAGDGYVEIDRLHPLRLSLVHRVGVALTRRLTSAGKPNRAKLREPGPDAIGLSDDSRPGPARRPSERPSLWYTGSGPS